VAVGRRGRGGLGVKQHGQLWQHDQDRPLAATLLFSAKESVYRAIYPQVKRVLEYDAVELATHDPAAGVLVFAAGLELNAALGRGFAAKVSSIMIEDLVLAPASPDPRYRKSGASSGCRVRFIAQKSRRFPCCS
jgi:hypothetical protein